MASRAAEVIRDAGESDYPAIAALLDLIFGSRRYDDRVRLWRWRRNASAFGADGMPPFLVAEVERRIVGVQGLFPLRLKVGDETLMASCSCDLAVHPTARSVGMRLKLEAASKEIAPIHITTSASGPANRMTLALGGKEIERGRYTYLKPLRTGRLLAQALEAKVGQRTAGVAAWALGSVGDLWLGLADRREYRPPSEGISFDDVEEFGPEFDSFWATLARHYSAMIVRDADYLNWRYCQYPFPGIQAFTLREDGALRGFAALHASTDEVGIPFATILDTVTLPGDEVGIRCLLQECRARAIAAECEYLKARAPVAACHSDFVAAGYRLSESEFSVATYRNNVARNDELLADDGGWYLSMGDGDGAFYFP